MNFSDPAFVLLLHGQSVCGDKWFFKVSPKKVIFFTYICIGNGERKCLHKPVITFKNAFLSEF